jgi:hypothetical protein
MKINIVVAALVLAIIYFSPSLFFGIIAFIGIVVLWAVFHCRDDVFATVKAMRQEKRAEQDRRQLSARLATAKTSLDGGDATPMRRLAEESSLGDAWCALAAAYKAAPDDVRDEAAITDAYQRAGASTWLVEGSRSCEREYETRYFYGLGVQTDYARLIKDWGEGYRRGEGHEADLAWIHTFGPEKLRDYERAWMWISLGKERNSSLPSHILSDKQKEAVLNMVTAKVSERVRRRINGESEGEAYREFVDGK